MCANKAVPRQRMTLTEHDRSPKQEQRQAHLQHLRRGPPDFGIASDVSGPSTGDDVAWQATRLPSYCSTSKAFMQALTSSIANARPHNGGVTTPIGLQMQQFPAPSSFGSCTTMKPCSPAGFLGFCPQVSVYTRQGRGVMFHIELVHCTVLSNSQECSD